MPKTNQQGQTKESELPDTLKRSPKKAQRTFAKTHDSAAEEYGEGERAHRVAFSTLKHTHEKVGDHWEPKDEKGPSDPRAKNPRAREQGQDLWGSRFLRQLQEGAVRARQEARHKGPIQHVQGRAGGGDLEEAVAGMLVTFPKRRPA